jgi:hypothetical protein
MDFCVYLLAKTAQDSKTMSEEQKNHLFAAAELLLMAADKMRPELEN